MADIHIADFYKDCAKILVRLYNSFPNKIVLYVDDIAGEATPDEFGLHSERYLSALSTMIWLAESGYIRFDSCIKQDAIDQAVLTEQGFLLLSSRIINDPASQPADHQELPLSVFNASQRTVQRLREALKSGSSTLLENYVSALLMHGKY